MNDPTPSRHQFSQLPPSPASSSDEAAAQAETPTIGALCRTAGAVKDMKWQPFWLRRKVLGSFFSVFLCLAVLLAVSTSYSERRQGLFQTSDSLVYLWRFGPAASNDNPPPQVNYREASDSVLVLTLISILWSRVELQFLRYLQWIVARPGKSLDRESCRLDYSQMMLPMMLFRSWKAKNYSVFLVITISIMLKVQIVLSAGLLYIKAVQVEQSTAIHVLDSFNVAEGDSNNSEMFSAYYAARAVSDLGMALPFGMSKGVIYQTFEERGTVDSPVRAVVDGLFTNMTCLNLDSYEVIEIDATFIQNDYTEDWYKFVFKLQLHFEGCGEAIATSTDDDEILSATSIDGGSTAWWAVVDFGSERPCSALPQHNGQFAYIAISLNPQNLIFGATPPRIKTVAAVLCTPSVWVSKVEILDDGVTQNVTDIPDKSVFLVNSTIWNTLARSIPHRLGHWFYSWYSWSYAAPRGPVYAAALFRSAQAYADDQSLYQNSVLRQAVFDVWDAISPFISQHVTRKQQNSQADAVVMKSINKLHVNYTIGSSMAWLFCISSFIALWVMIWLEETSGLWFRDPATLLGHLTWVNNCSLEEVTSQSKDSIKMQWSDGTSSPLALRSWLRALFSVFCTCIIAVLLLGSHASSTNQGLTTIHGPDNNLILWTSLPTLIMFAIAQYINICDSSIRQLAVLWILSKRDCSAMELDLSLLDMLGFRALYYSFRLRIPAVIFSQILTATAAFLTALTAVLFRSEQIPENTEVLLQRQDWFGGRDFSSVSWTDYNAGRETIQTFISTERISNLTYPSNIYQDLLFPTLQLDHLGWDKGTSIIAHIPAAKANPNCVRVPETEYNVISTKNSAALTMKESCPGEAPLTIFEHWNGLDVDNETRLFAESLTPLGDPIGYGTACQPHYVADDKRVISDFHVPWRLQMYFWGEFSLSSMSFNHLSIWQCNFSWVEIMTETRLMQADGGHWMIDHARPPVQKLDDVQPWMPSFAIPDIGEQLIDLICGIFRNGTETWVSGMHTAIPNLGSLEVQKLGWRTEIFSVILEPNGPIRLKDLGDKRREPEILKELCFVYAEAAAHVANLEHRLALDEHSVTPPKEHGELSSVMATIEKGARYRLVQNPVPTFILIGILSFIVLVNIWALATEYLGLRLGWKQCWLLDMELKGLAPDGFNSIEYKEALFYGSNFGACIPENAQYLNPEELYRQLAEKRFRMGWFGRGRIARVYTVAEAHDEAFPFLGEKNATSCISPELPTSIRLNMLL